MKFFQEIFTAAKSRDDKRLTNILKKGACIDTRHYDEFLCSPAGELARLGDIDSARYLVDFYGANPFLVIIGLLQGGNKQEATQWQNEFEVNSDYLVNHMRLIKYVYEAAIKPNKCKDTFYSNNSDNDAPAITGDVDMKNYSKLSFFNRKFYNNNLAHGGHIYLLEKIHKKYIINNLPQLLELFQSESVSSQIGTSVLRLQTPKLALHALSFVKDDKFLSAILKKLIKSGSVDYDIEPVMDEARRIRKIMQTEKVGFSEAMLSERKSSLEVTPLLKRNYLLFRKTTHIRSSPEGLQLNSTFSLM